MTTGTQLRLKGLESASRHYEADLRLAQVLAEQAGREGRILSTDDIRWLFHALKGRELEIGNALPKIFADTDKWQVYGRVKSTRKAAHGRYINTYQLKAVTHDPKPQHEVGISNGQRFCKACLAETEKCTCHKSTTP